jgi:hypothetical protein
VTTAATRAIAASVLATFVLVPSGLLLAAPALADESPAPSTGIGEPAYEEAANIPATEVSAEPDAYPDEPTVVAPDGSISGGTLQAGSGAVARPAAKPVAKPVAKPRAAAPRAVAPRKAPRTSAPAGPTVLPFTGPERLERQLAVGGGLVLIGAVVLLAARPRTA